MRPFLLLIATTILTFACTPETIYVDAVEHIYINVNKPTSPEQLSSEEIVKQTYAIKGFNQNYLNMPGDHIWQTEIKNDQRLPLTKQFKLPGLMVIDDEGLINTHFIKSSNIILVRQKIDNKNAFDTIAYIPNSNMNKANSSIINAFNQSRYEECYKIFEELFIFTPITGEQYLKIKK